MNAALFDLTPNYASASFPEPRPFQVTAHESLRQGRRAGHKNQLLMAPTGAGKSYLGLRICHEALLKGKRAMFVCDRTTLINQTSATADRYGLSAHGILQASHWRYDASAPFIIASAQTIQRRKWPEADVIVIDEAHTQLSVWTDYITECSASVVGLSATPFSKGLGKLFTNLVNATTMHELTQSGVLVPMRVFSCTRTNMDGAATRGGEWTDEAAEARGLAIIGDVVAEWLKFGENRKTIVFGSTIKHCEELCRQFNEAGVMAAVFTARTTQTERDQLLKDYTAKDGALKVLISVEALAKGFDVQDVGCVVDCRPLRKSLSTAIQMWGRGLRSAPGTDKKDCLARGTLVLTDHGEVPIEHVTRGHKVWDGENFVEHGGAVCRGVQRVIEYDGLIATPDHEVWTNDGWTRIETATHRGLRIARTGAGGQPIRLAEDRVADDTRKRFQPPRGSAVLEMPGSALCAVPQHPQATQHGGLPALQWAVASAGAAMAVSTVSGAVAAVHESASRFVRAVWRAWDRISFCLSQRGSALGGREPGDCRAVDALGSQGQQRALRAGQPAVVNARREPEQHKGFWGASEIHSVSQGTPAGQVCGRNACEAHQSGTDGRADPGTLGRAFDQAEREVWDVLNAGPLQRFTANGRLVHNCILLDHTGNILRFAEDYTEIFFNGLDALDAGEKLDKAIRRDDEKKESKCPSCGYTPFASRCMACGFAKQSSALVEHEPGQMREVMLGKKKLADDKRHLWEQCCTYARAHGNPSTAKGRAAHLFKDMAGDWPPRAWAFEGTPDAVITRNVLNQIRAKNIAFAARMKSERAGVAA